MQILSTLAFVIITITSMVNLIIREWRFNAIALALQYLAAFVLVTLSWPVGMAVVKLIVGWMATTAIALTILRQHQNKYQCWTDRLWSEGGYNHYWKYQ